MKNIILYEDSYSMETSIRAIFNKTTWKIQSFSSSVSLINYIRDHGRDNDILLFDSNSSCKNSDWILNQLKNHTSHFNTLLFIRDSELNEEFRSLISRYSLKTISKPLDIKTIKSIINN